MTPHCSRPPARSLSARLLLATALAALAALATATAPTAAQSSSFVSPNGDVDWNRFYTAAETNQILREFAALYPGLTELHNIGESFYGQPLMVLTITNEATGPAAEKPAFYVDGGIHAGELTASAVATHLIGHLLNGYGNDPRVTALLDARAFYVRPKFNPDGSDLALIDDQFLRSTPHPFDDDEDGTADEDPPEDLDGDGWITQIRVPDPDGIWVADPDDDRIMVRDPEMERAGLRFSTVREGVDNDGDGQINEDGIGGLDMNRNFPRNWERVHRQPGAGDYPLSEPETRAAVEFINAHRNITGIYAGHTSGGFVYRLPSASAPSLFPQIDLSLILHLGEEYTRSTGRPVVPSATHPTEHRYGTLITWGYWDHGVIGWVPEFSPGPEAWVTDYDGDGEISEAEQHRFNDEELGGRYFSDWTPYDHPQLGAVEIGGWHAKFWGQNPPPEFLEEETEQQLHWILYLAEQGPLIEVSDPVVTAVGDGTFRVAVTVTNTGFQPTSVTDRGAVGRERADGTVDRRVVRAPAVTLTHPGLEIVEGRARTVIPHLAGSNPFLEAAKERSHTVTWVVRAVGGERAVRVTAESDKGGTVRSGWVVVR
ncbi:MAG: M14 family metallopeptidase [Gemmatimonadetes bacterium]|nr:M14 family metallopeptidase [Gemmatimonadota bacterium]MCY3679039.1 M14 family metallopeptidase [Gemmatimonadota bacterium]